VKAADRIKDDTRRARDRFRSGNDAMMQRTRKLSHTFLKLVGIAMIGLASMFLILFALVTTGLIDVVPTTGDEEYTSLHDFLHIVAPVENTFTLMWAAILLVGYSGALLAILSGTRLLMDKTSRVFKIGFIALPILIGVGILCGVISGLQTGRDIAVYTEAPRPELTTNANQLIVEEMPHYIDNQRILSSGGLDFTDIRNGIVTEQGVLITYRASKDSLFHITQVISARGVDRYSAARRCKHVRHSVQLLGEKLIVDPNVAYPAHDGFRDQEVEVIIEVPKGKRLFIKDFEIEDPEESGQGFLLPNRPFHPFDEDWNPF
jgi:hypothetical protein